MAIGYGIYGVGMTMCMLKIFYWSQLHHVLGPLSISIKKVRLLLYFYSIEHFLTVILIGTLLSVFVSTNA